MSVARISEFKFESSKKTEVEAKTDELTEKKSETQKSKEKK